PGRPRHPTRAVAPDLARPGRQPRRRRRGADPGRGPLPGRADRPRPALQRRRPRGGAGADRVAPPAPPAPARPVAPRPGPRRRAGPGRLARPGPVDAAGPVGRPLDLRAPGAARPAGAAAAVLTRAAVTEADLPGIIEQMRQRPGGHRMRVVMMG